MMTGLWVTTLEKMPDSKYASIDAIIDMIKQADTDSLFAGHQNLIVYQMEDHSRLDEYFGNPSKTETFAFQPYTLMDDKCSHTEAHETSKHFISSMFGAIKNSVTFGRDVDGAVHVTWFNDMCNATLKQHPIKMSEVSIHVPGGEAMKYTPTVIREFKPMFSRTFKRSYKDATDFSKYWRMVAISTGMPCIIESQASPLYERKYTMPDPGVPTHQFNLDYYRNQIIEKAHDTESVLPLLRNALCEARLSVHLSESAVQTEGMA